MWEDLRTAAREGVLLGVKWGIALVLSLLALSLVLGDYTRVRDQAAKGQQAFEFLAQQQAAPPTTPATPAP